MQNLVLNLLQLRLGRCRLDDELLTLALDRLGLGGRDCRRWLSLWQGGEFWPLGIGLEIQVFFRTLKDITSQKMQRLDTDLKSPFWILCMSKGVNVDESG